jgi:DNA-binding PadR family transcriptional regulator
MVNMIKNEAQLEKLISELRRGTLVLSVLSQLHDEQYGYSLMQNLTAKGMDIEQGTLYPLLRRLEKQGLLVSEWRVEEGRPRRYYRISSAGEAIELALAAEWRVIREVMDGLLP